ncbi:LysR substrate-binding domain-containing protein [Kiloniella litopenaei]|uniref:LysR substrate-binding domain-containing protein n=1 Tax=Kiloniella litopenaei TaxID=1549748 RepID=UPI003BAB1884
MLKKRKLPPLNSLKAFEAAARTRSVKLASEELNVSASAVSQQIKTLEQWMGFRLLKRGPNSFTLTDKGERYLQQLTVLFDKLDIETAKVIHNFKKTKLRVSTLQSFAAEWLSPRIKSFRETYPEIQLELLTSDYLADLASEEIDLAIRYGPGGYKGVNEEKLMDEMIGPACHPDLLKSGNVLSDYTLLRDSGGPEGIKLTLERWLNKTTEGPGNREDSIAFSDTHLLINAARQGQGVMLGRSVLIADDIKQGTLVPVMTDWQQSPFSYYLVHSDIRGLSETAKHFRRWLLKEVEKFEAQLPASLAVPD